MNNFYFRILSNFLGALQKGIVGHFSKAAPDEIFTVGDRLLGFAYIPKSSIVYLETGEVIVR